MPLLTSTMEIVTIALPADGSETSYTFKKPCGKYLIRAQYSGFGGPVEGNFRLATASGNCADGGAFCGVKVGEAFVVDEIGGIPSTLWLRTNAAAVAGLVLILIIWS